MFNHFQTSSSTNTPQKWNSWILCFWSDIMKCGKCRDRGYVALWWLTAIQRQTSQDIIISHLLNPFFSYCVVVCSFQWLISPAPLNLWLYSMKSGDEGFPQGFALPFIFISALYWMSLISASEEAGRWRQGKIDEEKEGHMGWLHCRGEAEDRILKKNEEMRG